MTINFHRTLCFSLLASLAASGCDEGTRSAETELDAVEERGSFFSRLPGFAALGASITAGVGASSPELGSTALFASYLEDEYFGREVDVVNLSVPGATSEDILEDQTLDGIRFNLQHLFRRKVIWVASGGNDLLALVGTPGALDPCGLPPEVPELGVSFACYEVFGEVSEAYERNLRETLRRMRLLANKHHAVLIVRTELNGLDEDNCLEDGAIDQQGEVFIPAEQVASLRALGDLAIEGDVPPIADLGFPGFKGLNTIMREVAAEYDAVVVDTFATFKGAALQGGDLVTRDCVHPNDEGHAAIYSLAVEAFEASEL